jgi:hypothetical protein
MMNAGELQRRAKRRMAQLDRRRRDPRYRRVLGRLVRLGLLTTNETVHKTRATIDVADALWAAEIEPRIAELLPALLVRRPALFVDARALPDDLAQVVAALRRNQVPADFRGIPGQQIHRWLGSVGRKSEPPSRLKAFRLQSSDLALLTRLRDELGITETAVVRRGLRALSSATWLRESADADL